MIDFKGSHFEKETIWWGVRWYVAYPISYRQLEEMRQERGVAVDHSALDRRVIKYAPEFEKQFRLRKRPVGKSLRLDETYSKVKGEWKYLYRAVDRDGQTVDFLLTPQRDQVDRRGISTQGHSPPRDSRRRSPVIRVAANTAAINHSNKMHKTAIVLPQCTYLNNIVEQDHRAGKRITRPMLGFKSFWAAPLYDRGH